MQAREENGRCRTRALSRRRFLRAGALAGLAAGFGRSSWADDALAAPAGGGGRVRSGEPPVIQRLSWAGVKLELEGVTLFIDPLEGPSFFGDAWTEPKVPVRADTERRYVLVTHLHTDHFDAPTLRELLGAPAAGAAVVCHAPVAAEVASEGLRTRGHALYELRSYGGFGVAPVPAVDGWGIDQVSWVVEAGGVRIIHCGDTLWHGAWWDLARAYGPFDLAFLPINGARAPGRTPPSGVPATLTPEQAVAAGLVLGARAVVPIHYGVSIPGDYEEYPRAEEVFLETARRRGLATLLMADGETLDWGAIR